MQTKAQQLVSNKSPKGRAAHKRYRKSPKGRAATKRYNSAHHRDIHYGKGAQQHFLQQMEEQQSKCAICGKDISGGGLGGAYLDHNHNTDQWRGALCPGCNTLIGCIEMGEDVLLRAQAYLASWENRGNNSRSVGRLSSDNDGAIVNQVISPERSFLPSICVQ